MDLEVIQVLIIHFYCVFSKGLREFFYNIYDHFMIRLGNFGQIQKVALFLTSIPGYMGKRALTNYLAELPRKELEEQLLDLYQRFPVVKEYYDFAFNPKEDKLIQAAKAKIANEYFPVKRKRPKARRSVAQKLIKHFISLGMEPFLVADLMLYNLEIAQTFESERKVPEAFYKSMRNSFHGAVQFLVVHGAFAEFKDRVLIIFRSVQDRHWPNAHDFSKALDLVE